MDWCCRSSLFGDRLRLNKAQSEIKHVYTYAETIRKCIFIDSRYVRNESIFDNIQIIGSAQSSIHVQ